MPLADQEMAWVVLSSVLEFSFEGQKYEFGLDPAVDTTMRSDPRRQVGQPSSPVGQITEQPLDVRALPEQLWSQP
jgi:hypothetical protein